MISYLGVLYLNKVVEVDSKDLEVEGKKVRHVEVADMVVEGKQEVGMVIEDKQLDEVEEGKKMIDMPLD